MQLDKSSPPAAARTKPQLHSRQCHYTYNGTRHLPRAIWIRSLRFDLDPDLLDDSTTTTSSSLTYEILLYYDHNRACTIYRSPEDFRRLKCAVGRLSTTAAAATTTTTTTTTTSISDERVVEDVEVLQRFLVEALRKKGGDWAVEYFLRRRMDDCGGL
ncbi:hypothetical protein M406DRAFT_331258 [Cryphonectria parasitica EP155]|uniref:Uncharacterized protein n=1 Tax=Cryphonectria parasitica (strain ATCC 38755 / EP155) TaxID=660469 RepID=A0A9P5CNA0_CRYP1|nr:uncharacterized protein M406DRAFT_331258 [Cryphonectria parasitica EP155]KAF3764943.1 hypothetical protein M406DRAFT_331258 [Cryphonectria parasitica EP155]